MQYLIKHANGECTPVSSPLSLEDLFSFIKRNEDQFIIFKESDDFLFVGTEYLKNCIIMAAQDPEPMIMDEMPISDYF